MVSALLAAGAKAAGSYLVAKARKKIVKYGKRAIKKGIKRALKPAFSKNKGDQGSVNMIKHGLTDRSKGTLGSAYNTDEMSRSKRALTNRENIGGSQYAIRKIMPQQTAMAYGNTGAMKTRR